jgi:hypothetical protein
MFDLKATVHILYTVRPHVDVTGDDCGPEMSVRYVTAKWLLYRGNTNPYRILFATRARSGF